MSVFTHHPFYTVNNNDLGNFGGLVRFIDDWDKHFTQEQNSRSGQGQLQQGPQARRSVTQTFTPRFDVRETDDNYELHGELPGVDKKNISIEFSDPQTIIIRGHIERTYTAGTPPAGLIDNNNAMSGAITDNPQKEGDAQETGSNKSHQPTVEDDKEGTDKKTTGTESTPATTTSAESSKPENSTSQPKSKYWVYERSVGNFQRSFTFASRVDHDNVSASLDNGILTVIVPKAKKPETRRIAIH
ncbi:30 kDa heat shock protein [Xylariaceae sp. AK1471]|nr:30 kDa heat shock protein [Xylariaceae sp. AK1471]